MATEQPDPMTRESLASRLLRFYRRPYVHTGIGLLVLAAIIGTLVIISRVMDEGGGSELVEISEAPGGETRAGASTGLGPLDGGPPKWASRRRTSHCATWTARCTG
jgi:hypothetical protein